MKNFFLLVTILLFLITLSFGQDTLPKFSVINPGNNRIIIGWVNNYGLVKQISIQRSFDSLSNYKTILSVADPNSRQNGYADSKAPYSQMFYRLFVVMGQGQYFFTEAKKPFLDTASITQTSMIEKSKTKIPVNNNSGASKKPDFVPSFYVYTNRDGYVFINLPDAHKKKYHIRFYEEDGSFLFEIKSIKEPALTLDKINFIHAGWFGFELFNDETLVEKNKFYLAKEF